MSNVISIKTGAGAPTTSDLVIGELGFDLTNNTLYIGKSDSVWGINLFDNIVSGGVLPIGKGGTGATTADQARANLGVGYKIYSSVVDLGFIAGQASIIDTYAAMANNSLIICDGEDFLSTETPSASGLGVVYMARSVGTWRGFISFHGKDSGVKTYRMYLDSSGVPDGTWRLIFDSSSVIPLSNGGTGQTTAAGVRNILGLGNTTGALPIANGGTGQTTAAGTRNALGLGNTTGALPIANGGTGQTTAAGVRNVLGLGNTTGAVPIANGGTDASNVRDAANNLFVMGLRDRVDIPASSNFNSYTTPGNYRIASSVTATTMTNIPCERAGTLTVMQSLGGATADYITQIYSAFDITDITNKGGIWVRQYVASAWRQWRVVHIGETIVTTPAVTPSAGSVSFFYCCKVGRVVTFNMRLTSAALSSGITSLGNIIPDGYRPMSGDTALSVYTGNDTNNSQGWVGTAGNVNVRLSASTTGITLIMSGSWIIPD